MRGLMTPLFMTKEERELLVSRIIAGVYYYKEYVIVPPTRLQKYKAAILYKEALKRTAFDSIFDLADINRISKKWLPEDDKVFLDVEKAIENAKVDLYLNHLNKDKLKFIRRNLDMLKDKLDDCYKRQRQDENLTSAGYANSVKGTYLFAVTIQDKGGNYLWNDNNYQEVPQSLIDDIALELVDNVININDFREIARNEPWRSIWTSNKENVFGLPAVDLTEEQRTLIMFSKMYDTVYENPERPPDNIIEDDDMLDGWFILQRRKVDDELKSKQAEQMIPGKAGQFQEVFLPASNADHARQINDLNNQQGKKIKEQRFAVINNRGQVDELNLPDRKMELIMQANQQEHKHAKG